MLSLAICSTQDRLFELRDFRIPRVMPFAIEQFAASMHLVLDPADKYPRDSLVAHILDVIPQFLPALFIPCSRRVRVRQIVSNAKRFQRGEWEGLWETAVRFPRKESDNTTQRSQLEPLEEPLPTAESCRRNIARVGAI